MKTTTSAILRAAKTSATGRYGSHLVLINHVHAELVRTGATTLTLANFKHLLLALYVRGALILSKADMPQTLAASDLDAAEVFDGDRRLVFIEM